MLGCFDIRNEAHRRWAVLFDTAKLQKFAKTAKLLLENFSTNFRFGQLFVVGKNLTIYKAICCVNFWETFVRLRQLVVGCNSLSWLSGGGGNCALCIAHYALYIKV